MEALLGWAEEVLELVAQGARLTAAKDRQVTLALDLRKERAAQIAAGRAQQAAAAAAETAVVGWQGHVLPSPHAPAAPSRP